MRIDVVRSGGFAGLTRRATLDPAPADVEALARAAEASALPAGRPSADAFTYEVTIDGRRYVLHDASGAWGELIDRLRSV